MSTPLVSDLQHDPVVERLLDFARRKKTVTYDEVNDFLPDWIVNSDRIDEIATILEKNGIKLEDEDVADEPDRPAVANRRLVYNDKDSAVDDPIRLYLREIGRENLLTADDEVRLSKEMEEGENTIKDVFTSSGALIPQFFDIAERARSAKDPRELNLNKKEASEFLADRRRLNAWYKETIRDLYANLKCYIETKKHIAAEGGMVLGSDRLQAMRDPILKALKSIAFHRRRSTRSPTGSPKRLARSASSAPSSATSKASSRWATRRSCAAWAAAWRRTPSASASRAIWRPPPRRSRS